MFKYFEEIESMKMLASIYKITNQVNGKIYIGKTTADPNSRFKGHIQDSLRKHSPNLIHRAIRKYGVENFDFEVIFQMKDASKDELNLFEKYFIKVYNSCILDENSCGYNMTRGGDGWDSDFVKNISRKRINDGTHNFLGSDHARKTQTKRLRENTHNLSGTRGKELQRQRFLNGSHPTQQIRTCPHCHTTVKGPQIFRYHYDKCKFRPQFLLEVGLEEYSA